MRMRYFALLIAALVIAGSPQLLARESNGTPAAHAFLAEGEAAVKAGKLPDATRSNVVLP